MSGMRGICRSRPRPGRKRITKRDYYLDIAQQVAMRSTCLRRCFGAVIVSNDQIIATGYNGAPRGTANCIDVGACYREKTGAKPGEHYERCRAVHAEQNAIIHASRFDMLDGTMYVVGIYPATKKLVQDAQCCRMCKRMILNAGLTRVVIRTGPGRSAVHSVETWKRRNLGELKRRNGRLVPVRVPGY